MQFLLLRRVETVVEVGEGGYDLRRFVVHFPGAFLNYRQNPRLIQGRLREEFIDRLAGIAVPFAVFTVCGQ